MHCQDIGLIISYITFLLFLWYYLHYIKTNIIVGSFIDIGKEMTIILGNKYLIINNAVSLLQFADVFIILINYKKRAIHDYMAGSFVVFKNRKTKA